MTSPALMDSSSARELTDQIKVGVEAVWELIKQAYQSRAWDALGYSSWDDYCTREFGTSRIRLPREERQEVVASMREIGMSTRAIASATGTSEATARRALTGASNDAPVTGTDGKVYPSRPTPREEVEQITDELHEMPVADDEYREKFDALVDAEERRRDEIAPGITADELDDLHVRPQPEPQAPRRRPLEEQFFDATHKLTGVCTTLQNLGDDDRLPRNREQVARYRSDLLRAIDVLQHVVNQMS